MEKTKERIGLDYIIRGYRYISIIITSIFFVINNKDISDVKSLGILLGMITCCVLTDYLYYSNKSNMYNTWVIVIIEIIANTIFINISGGFNSCYIWYAINSVLILAIKFGEKWSWINLLFYIVTVVINTGIKGQDILYIGDVNIMLALVFTTGTLHWILRCEKSVLERNNFLVRTHKKSQQSLDYVLETYETLYLFVNEKSRGSIIEILFEYIECIWNVENVAYIEYLGEGQKKYYKKNLDQFVVEDIYTKIEKHLIELGEKSFCKKIFYRNEIYTVIPIMYSNDYYGTLLIKSVHQGEDIRVITYLTRMTLKRIKLEAIHENFVLSSEQNRIANEIHDSVLQKLFGVSCNLYTIGKTIEDKTTDVLKEELDEIRTLINSGMSELRETIYDMSWHRNGKSSFPNAIKKYVNEMSNLYKIKINLVVDGDEENLGATQKKVLYRIVCEGTSNASRHGKAKNIKIKINISKYMTTLKISDDGIGFNYEKLVKNNLLGLGIRNMQYLAKMVLGKLDIISNEGIGTQINMVVPSDEIYKEEIYESTYCG